MKFFNKKLSIIISIFIVVVFPALSTPKTALAVLCSGFKSTSSTLTNTDCVISGVMGLDEPLNSDTSTINRAPLVLGNSVNDPNSPVNITINSGAIMAAGEITIRKNVSIAIAEGGQIVSGRPLYVTDADGDGWPEDFTVYTATAAGRRRLGLMRSMTVADCNDAPGNYDLANISGIFYQDDDGDGKGTAAVSSGGCFSPPGYVADNTDCNDGSALVSISHAQCNADVDGDTYTSGLAANSTCLNTSSCDTATYASASTNGAAVTNYVAGRLKNSASGTADCNDGSTSVFIPHAQCYADADGDTFTAGLASNTTCLNTASCATATNASASTNGAAVTAYSSGRLQNSASATTDCKDTGTNASLVMYPLTCYHDSDDDSFGVATTKTCLSTNSCATATYGSTGTADDVTNINFSTVSTDCYDSNATAFPGSTTCSGTNRGDGSYDYNCSTTSTKCGTNYTYGTGTINRNYTDVCGSCGNCNRRCCGGSNLIYSTATINCGQTGGTCTNMTGCQGGSCSRNIGQMCGSNPACEDYSGSGPTCNLCKAISTGTQACQ